MKRAIALLFLGMYLMGCQTEVKPADKEQTEAAPEPTDVEKVEENVPPDPPQNSTSERSAQQDAEAAEDPTVYRVYNDLKLGFTTAFPAAWKVDQTGSALSLVAVEPLQGQTDRFSESISIGTFPHKGQSLEDLAQENLKRAQESYPMAKIGIADFNNENGVECRVIEVTQILKDGSITAFTAVFRHATHSILLTLTMEGDKKPFYLPVRSKFFNSFRWLSESERNTLKAKN